MNPKEEDLKETKNECENVNPTNPNKYLLSFLIDNSDGDDYFKNSDDEYVDDNKNNNCNTIILKKNNISNNINYSSISNYNENSTKDNSNNNYSNTLNYILLNYFTFFKIHLFIDTLFYYTFL